MDPSTFDLVRQSDALILALHGLPIERRRRVVKGLIRRLVRNSGVHRLDVLLVEQSSREQAEAVESGRHDHLPGSNAMAVKDDLGSGSRWLKAAGTPLWTDIVDLWEGVDAPTDRHTAGPLDTMHALITHDAARGGVGGRQASELRPTCVWGRLRGDRERRYPIAPFPPLTLREWRSRRSRRQLAERLSECDRGTAPTPRSGCVGTPCSDASQAAPAAAWLRLSAEESRCPSHVDPYGRRRTCGGVPVVTAKSPTIGLLTGARSCRGGHRRSGAPSLLAASEGCACRAKRTCVFESTVVFFWKLLGGPEASTPLGQESRLPMRSPASLVSQSPIGPSGASRVPDSAAATSRWVSSVGCRTSRSTSNTAACS